MCNNRFNYTSKPHTFRNRIKKSKFELARKMRKNPTPAENALWKIIRNKKTGFRFRRQSPILGYIADFYCPSISLIIEVDGKWHKFNKKYDVKRDLILERKGFVVLRVTNEDVLKTPHFVLAEIFRIGNLIGRSTNPI